MKFLIFILLHLLWTFTMDASDTAKAIMPTKHSRIITKYCLDCHDKDTQKGEVNLENLSFDLGSDMRVAERWQDILNSINSGDMPPKKKTQLTAQEKTSFLSDLSEKMVVARKIHADNGGIITLRRLNRREYANTIEVLLGVRPSLNNLPNDQPGAGFDTAGASLYFSSDQFERYIETARAALEMTLDNRAQRRIKVRMEAERRNGPAVYQKRIKEYKEPADRARAFQSVKKQSLKKFGFKKIKNVKVALKNESLWVPAFEKYLSYPEAQKGTLLMSWQKYGVTTIPVFSTKNKKVGNSVIRARVARYAETSSRYHYLEFIAKNNRSRSVRTLGWRKVSASIDQPEIIEFPIPKASMGSSETYCVRMRTNGAKLHVQYFPKVDSPAGIWVDWVEHECDAIPGTPTAEASAVFFSRQKGDDEAEYARKIISRFATRAFRITTPSKKYLDKLLVQFKLKRAAGESFQKAVIHSLSLVLASPSFLYMVESNGKGRLTGPELAVRLSYFLWSSPPDEILLSAARRGDLSDPSKLKQQTSRMLADSRADNFIHAFAYQWLGMKRFGMFQFSVLLYPEFDSAVFENSSSEIYKTFRYLLDHKLPLRLLLKSNFVIVNDVMADYYGIDNVKGHNFRKVNLPPNSIRGGLLGTAAILAMGSDGKRSSPVERGAWVLRHLLNRPPPPAPANVPQLSTIENQVQPARNLLSVHQEEAQCAQCHRKIDPIGFAMENFDAVGRWRSEEIVGELSNKSFKVIKSFKIDPKVVLGNGTKVNSFFELRDAVATRQSDLARGLTESLIAYGLGRPYGFSDIVLADRILKKAKVNDYNISSLIHALIQTTEFQSK